MLECLSSTTCCAVLENMVTLLTHLLTMPHGTLAEADDGQVLRPIQPDDTDFSLRDPGKVCKVTVPGEAERVSNEDLLG